MAFSFSADDAHHIADVLGTDAKQEGDLWRYELQHEESGRRLTLEVHPTLEAPHDMDETHRGGLVSVFAPASFLQLQHCTGFIASQELGEVIFFARRERTTNGLVIEREVGSSLYANVDDRLLSADFTQLPPELVMSSVALSMTETIFDSLG